MKREDAASLFLAEKVKNDEERGRRIIVFGRKSKNIEEHSVHLRQHSQTS